MKDKTARNSPCRSRTAGSGAALNVANPHLPISKGDTPCEIVFIWVEGKDWLIFESFASHVGRKVTFTLQESGDVSRWVTLYVNCHIARPHRDLKAESSGRAKRAEFGDVEATSTNQRPP